MASPALHLCSNIRTSTKVVQERHITLNFYWLSSLPKNMPVDVPDSQAAVRQVVFWQGNHPHRFTFFYRCTIFKEHKWPSSHKHNHIALQETVKSLPHHFVDCHIQEAEAQLDEGKVGFVEATALTHKQVLEMAVAEASRRVHEATK